MSASKLLIRNYMADSVKELEQLLKDVGGCDHQVGICCCGLKQLIEDGKRILKEEI